LNDFGFFLFNSQSQAPLNFPLPGPEFRHQGWSHIWRKHLPVRRWILQLGQMSLSCGNSNNCSLDGLRFEIGFSSTFKLAREIWFSFSVWVEICGGGGYHILCKTFHFRKWIYKQTDEIFTGYLNFLFLRPWGLEGSFSSPGFWRPSSWASLSLGEIFLARGTPRLNIKNSRNHKWFHNLGQINFWSGPSSSFFSMAFWTCREIFFHDRGPRNNCKTSFLPCIRRYKLKQTRIDSPWNSFLLIITSGLV